MVRHASIAAARLTAEHSVVESRGRRGLVLIEVIVATLLMTGLLLLIRAFGSTGAIVALASAAVVLAGVYGWGCLYLPAPRLAANVAVLLVVGLLVISLLPNQLIRVRERARVVQCIENLRGIARRQQAETVDPFPPVAKADPDFRENSRRDAIAAHH